MIANLYNINDINKKNSYLKNKGVYSIINLNNGKVYVGSTSLSFYERWNIHLKNLKTNSHHSKYLQNSFNKYDYDSLQFKILEITDTNNLINREQFYFNLLNPEFNSCRIAGSPKGTKHSKETINKRVEKTFGKRKNYFFDKSVNKYKILFTINRKVYLFGSYKNKKDCILKIKFLKTLSKEELIKYWNINFNIKNTRKGYKFRKATNKYEIRITKNGQSMYFGSYSSEEDAANKAREIYSLLDKGLDYNDIK